MATIELNSSGDERYVLAKDSRGRALFHQRYVKKQSGPIRLAGTVFRENDPSMGHYTYKDFPLGIGWNLMDRRTGRGVGGVRFATADIRFATQTLQHQADSHTHAAPAQHPKGGFINHAGETWGFFEEDFASSLLTKVLCRKWNPDTWDTPTSGGTILTPLATNLGSRLFAVGTHKGNIIVVTNDTRSGTGSGSELSFTIWRNTDPEANAWTEMKGFGFPSSSDLQTTTTRANSITDNYAAVVDEGDILLVALLFDASAYTVANAIRVYETSDLGANYSLTATIDGVTEVPMGFHRWRDPTSLGFITSILVTNYNIYKIDSSANSATPLLPEGTLTGDANDGRANTVGLDGALYLSLASGDNLRITVELDNQYVIENIGPATGVQHAGQFVDNDGLPAAFQGHANYVLDTPSDWMYWAYGGHVATTNATVLAYSKSRMKWYCQYDEPDANIDIYLLGYSTEGDSIPRLFFCLENATAAEMFHQEYPNTPVTAGQTQRYEEQSYIDHPYDGYGDPRTSKGLFHAEMDADALTAGSSGAGGASDVYLTLQYGVDGAARTGSELGDFLSGQRELTFPAGATTVGVSVLNLGMRELFERDSTNTNTPERRELTIVGRPKLASKRAWDMTIDVEVTATEGGHTVANNTPVQETIISAIEMVAESVTKVTFTAGGLTQTQVIVPDENPPIFRLDIVESGGAARGYRTGFIDLTIEETS